VIGGLCLSLFSFKPEKQRKTNVMRRKLNVRLRWGHAGGHIRDTFLKAIEAYQDWDSGPEPTVEFEINYEPVQITISQACGLVWNCTDILPGTDYQSLQDCGIEPKRQTYAGAAHALLKAIKEERKNLISNP
jgi:hypothetical protein